MNKELDKLKGAIQMCCNMLNRSGRPAQQEAADELKSALGEFCEAARATPAQPVGYVLFTGHGDKFSREKPKCEIDYWKPVYLESSRPSPSSVGAAIRNLLDEQKTYAQGRDGDWWRGYGAALHWIGKAIEEMENKA